MLISYLDKEASLRIFRGIGEGSLYCDMESGMLINETE